MQGSRPFLTWKWGQLVLKGEDALRVCVQARWPSSEADRTNPPQATTSNSGSIGPIEGETNAADIYHLFCVFDGHNGAEAGTHCTQQMHQELHKRLPPGPVPDLSDTTDPRVPGFCQAVRRAFAETFLTLDMSFAERRVLSGCTATACLIVGWAAFVANVGDSSCCLDTGRKVEQLNYDHRLEDSEEEQKRVQRLGGVLAKLDESGLGPAITSQTGYGPLRVWPGGLALSRAIGDFDVGPCISAMPNIRQVRLPKSGSRLVLASDGLWDAFVTLASPMEKSRSMALNSVPEKLIDRSLQLRGLADDITIVAIDIMSHPHASFASLYGTRRGLLCCVAPKVDEVAEAPLSESFSVLHDEDSSMHGHPTKDLYSGIDRTTFGDLARLPVALGGQYVDNRTDAAAEAAKRSDASVKGGGYFYQLPEGPARERQVQGPTGANGTSKQFSYHDVSVHMPRNSIWWQQEQAELAKRNGVPPASVHAGAGAGGRAGAPGSEPPGPPQPPSTPYGQPSATGPMSIPAGQGGKVGGHAGRSLGPDTPNIDGTLGTEAASAALGSGSDMESDTAAVPPSDPDSMKSDGGGGPPATPPKLIAHLQQRVGG